MWVKNFGSNRLIKLEYIIHLQPNFHKYTIIDTFKRKIIRFYFICSNKKNITFNLIVLPYKLRRICVLLVC